MVSRNEIPLYDTLQTRNIEMYFFISVWMSKSSENEFQIQQLFISDFILHLLNHFFIFLQHCLLTGHLNLTSLALYSIFQIIL